MTRLKLIQDQRVLSKFENYPKEIQPKMHFLRDLILDAAAEIETISSIEETLKWGEPSYLVKKGSTIRIDWKSKFPNQYALYFKCTSKLVPTFKEIYGNLFKYEKNRAILFGLKDNIPVKALKSCIQMALEYHSIKHLDRLGK